MGVAWGIVEYSASCDREEVIGEWRPFAQAAFELNPRRTMSVLHGEDRITFRGSRDADGQVEVVTSVSKDRAARAQVDKLSFGDGSYDEFGRLFDGWEVFVPWSTIPGRFATSTRTWSASTLQRLEGGMRATLAELGDDDDLRGLARELFRAAYVAGRRNLLVTISY
jgi:hypothetical protein